MSELVIKHEKYSIDELNYQIVQWLSDPDRVAALPSNRFSGRRVRQALKSANPKRLHGKAKQIFKRDRRLRKYGMSVVLFAS
jgi:hypothetical protein